MLNLKTSSQRQIQSAFKILYAFLTLCLIATIVGQIYIRQSVQFAFASNYLTHNDSLINEIGKIHDLGYIIRADETISSEYSDYKYTFAANGSKKSVDLILTIRYSNGKYTAKSMVLTDVLF